MFKRKAFSIPLSVLGFSCLCFGFLSSCGKTGSTQLYFEASGELSNSLDQILPSDGIFNVSNSDDSQSDVAGVQYQMTLNLRSIPGSTILVFLNQTQVESFVNEESPFVSKLQPMTLQDGINEIEIKVSFKQKIKSTLRVQINKT